MIKHNIFQTITLILGAAAFIVIGMILAAFLSQKTENTQVKNSPVLSETQQIMHFLSLASNTQELGLYGEADPESLQLNLQALQESLSQTIQTQEDANLYMIYWAATAVHRCVYLDAQAHTISTSDLVGVATQSVEACIDDVSEQVQQNIAQMSDSERQVLIHSAEAWSALSSIVEYYNLFMQNNFVQVIQHNNQPATPTKQLTNESNTTTQKQDRG